MIVILKAGAGDAEIERVVDAVRKAGFTPHLSRGQERTIIGMIGDERTLNAAPIELLPCVERVVRILKPYKLASLEFHPERSRVAIGAAGVGGGPFTMMAGPCAVESREQTLAAALGVRAAGAAVLRGGAFKPRTSPYSFQGLGKRGLEILAEARAATGLPVVTEILAPEDLDDVLEVADCLQIGARNMQNFRLLEAVGGVDRPVLLKRGLMSTIEELLLAAEYILSRGNRNVVLCERGIRTFEPATRNTLDIAAVPLLRELSHLPVVVDPSHACGRRSLVAPLAKAALAAGADGILVEVHPDPSAALCDGQESLTCPEFASLAGDLRRLAEALGRSIEEGPRTNSVPSSEFRVPGSAAATGTATAAVESGREK